MWFYCSDDTNGRGPWWTDRVDFDCAKPTLGRSSDFDEDDEDSNDLASTSSAVGSDTGNLQDDILEKKTARFTEYSMTSSVVPRSEGSKLIYVVKNSVFNFHIEYKFVFKSLIALVSKKMTA